MPLLPNIPIYPTPAEELPFEGAVFTPDPEYAPDLLYNHYYISVIYPWYKADIISPFDYISYAFTGLPYPKGKSIEELFLDPSYLGPIFKQGKNPVWGEVYSSSKEFPRVYLGDMVYGVPKTFYEKIKPGEIPQPFIVYPGHLEIALYTPPAKIPWWKKLNPTALLFLGVDKLVLTLAAGSGLALLVEGASNLWGVLDKLSKWYTEEWKDKVDKYLTDFDIFVHRIETTIEAPFQTLKTSFYQNIEPFVTDFNEALYIYRKDVKTFIDLQMKVAKIIETPGNWLDENFTVPLRIMKGNLDEQLSKTANYLALFGINEGVRAKAQIDKAFDRLMYPAHFITMKIERWEKQVEVTLQEFYGDDFKKFQEKSDRATAIVNSTIELLNIEDPETARLRKQPFSQTLKAYPATTLASLDKGRDAYIPDMIVFPAPEEHMLPELKKWIERYDKSCGKMYIDDDENPLAPVVQNGVLKTKMEDYDGEVLSAVGTLNRTSYDSTDDLVVLGHLWSAAVDKGIIVDFAVPSEPQKIPFLLKMRFYAGYPGLWVGWILQDIWDDFGALHHFYYDPPDEENYNLAALEEDFWDSYNKFMIYLGELKAEGAQFGP